MKPRQMIIALLVGTLSGLLVNALAADAAWVTWVVNNVSTVIGQLFIRLLFVLVVPLLFSALVMGIAELDLKDLGKLGGRTLAYTVVVSIIAVSVGLVLVNVLQPGAGADPNIRTMAGASGIKAAPQPMDTSAAGVILSMVPENAVKAAANGDMIGIIVVAFIFGIALTRTRTAAARQLQGVMEGIYDVTMTCINGVMRLAPIGVGALLFSMTARVGGGPLKQVVAYVGVVMLGLAFHCFVVYSILLRTVGRTNPITFFRGARLAMITAFSTASSTATLPTALLVAEHQLKIPRGVSRFVLTVGATMNQNGTALFEGVTVLFLAQLYGVQLAFGQQALVMFICVLAGIGTAGVPAASLPVIAMILGMFKIPPEGLGFILGFDRLLDMSRTTLNVTGDLVAAVCVARGAQEEPSAPAPRDD
ncbi:MAG: dicarboxylate/amino acid:cation symporter [Deltaproteobacteria bacterium]|nr:dicarboxylate/amino acid:cation symporter [Deltaproteobacteria bacterium]